MKSKSILVLLLLGFQSISHLSHGQINKGSSVFTQKPITINLSDSRLDTLAKVNIRSQHSEHGKLIDRIKVDLDAQRAQHEMEKGEASNKRAIPKPEVVNSYQGNITNGTPADNSLAISNDGMVVSAVNSNVRFYDANGKLLLVRDLSTLAKEVGNLNSSYDPHVAYDPASDRFVLLFLSGYSSTNTNLIIGFSATANPTEQWHFYKIPGNVHGDKKWSDYPFLALSKEEVFVPVLLWFDGESGWESEAEEIIWQIDKKKGYAGEELSYKYYDHIKVSGKQVWNTRPVTGGMGTYGPQMYFVGNRAIDLKNDSIFLFEITNTVASGKAELKTKVLKSPVSYGIPPSAYQPKADDPLRTNYADVHSAVFHNSRIFFVGNTIGPDMRPSIYVGTITSPDADKPTISASIFSSSEYDLNYPSIAYAGGGGMDHSCIVQTLHSSATEFPGISVFYMDRNGKFSDLVTVKKGEGYLDVLSGDLERWGDYSGIQRRFNRTGEVWLGGCYVSTSHALSTWISNVKNTDPQLGIESTSIQGFALYPVPVADRVEVQCDITKAGFYKLSVYDMNGRLVKTVSNEFLTEGAIKISMDLSNLITGTYVLKIQGALQSYERKFIKR